MISQTLRNEEDENLFLQNQESLNMPTLIHIEENEKIYVDPY